MYLEVSQDVEIYTNIAANPLSRMKSYVTGAGTEVKGNPGAQGRVDHAASSRPGSARPAIHGSCGLATGEGSVSWV